MVPKESLPKFNCEEGVLFVVSEAGLGVAGKAVAQKIERRLKRAYAVGHELDSHQRVWAGGVPTSDGAVIPRKATKTLK